MEPSCVRTREPPASRSSLARVLARLTAATAKLTRLNSLRQPRASRFCWGFGRRGLTGTTASPPRSLIFTARGRGGGRRSALAASARGIPRAKGLACMLVSLSVDVKSCGSSKRCSIDAPRPPRVRGVSPTETSPDFPAWIRNSVRRVEAPGQPKLVPGSRRFFVRAGPSCSCQSWRAGMSAVLVPDTRDTRAISGPLSPPSLPPSFPLYLLSFPLPR